MAAGQGARLPHPLTRGPEPGVQTPPPRRALPSSDPGAASLLFPAGRWQLCPARPPARRSRCRPAAVSAGLRVPAPPAGGAGAPGAPANGAEPAPRPAPPRPRRPRAPAPGLPCAHPSPPLSVSFSSLALSVLRPGLLQRTLTPKQLFYCAQCSAVLL